MNDSTVENWKDFQYRAFIKNVYILLPGYKYRHTTSDIDDDKFVGRESVREQFLNYLKKGGAKGSYLITGYRGMGKTTLVNQVIRDFIGKDKKKKVKISISFGQKNITELDILRQIVYEIRNIIESKNKLGVFYTATAAVTVGAIITTGIFVYWLKLRAKSWGAIADGIDLISINEAIAVLLLSLILSVFLISIIRYILGCFNKPFRKIYNKISYLFDRCTSHFTSEESSGTGAEQFPIVLSSKKSKSYPIAGEKELSNEIIHTIKDIKENLSIEFVFVFDELDKIENNYYQTPHYEDTELLDLRGETISFSDHRKRKRLILDILSSLKYLISEAEAKFIFIAGSEMFDAALADVSDRHSAISSIFGHVINVDSLYKDKASRDMAGVGITNLMEYFLQKIIDPDKRNGKDQLLKFDWTGDKSFTPEDKLKVIYSLQHFINYLAYRSTGSPKKMIRIIEEHTRPVSDFVTDRKNIMVKANKRYADEKNGIYLALTYKDQYKVGLLNYFYRPVIISKSRTMKSFSDTLLVTIPYLMDHIHKFHGSAFSMENLELLPEVLSSNRAPELRMFLEDLIEQFKQNLIRETETKFFDYKFNYKIYNEIVHVSTLFAEESAAYNFSLDENYNIKVYLRLKIKELRNIYKDFGGKEISNSLDSIAVYNTLLGDVAYFDREYSDAIGCYLDALTALQNDGAKNAKPLTINNLHFVSYVRCLMKLGLSYEKIKSYDKAISCYLDVIDVIGKNKMVESDYVLKAEIHRYVINAMFSSLFIFEKQPALGGFIRLFGKVMSINGNKEARVYYKLLEEQGNPDSKQNIEMPDILRAANFRDFLFHQTSFCHALSLLLYYRNVEKDYDIIIESKNFSFLKKIKYNDGRKKLHDYASIILLNKVIMEDTGQASMHEVFLFLRNGYRNKDISSKLAFITARSLSRLGNMYYSIYFKRVEKNDRKEEEEEYNLKITEELKELINTIQQESKGKHKGRSLKDLPKNAKTFEDNINASDLIKEWLWTLDSPETEKTSGIIFDIKLLDIVYIYLLSAKLYLYADRSLMGMHQYRKILSVLRNFAKQIRKIREEKEADVDDFLIFLKVSLVKRSLQIASWMSSSTDRSQVYKYKHAHGIDYIYHGEEWTKYNYKNASNSPDIKEALWHFLCLDEICRPGTNASLDEAISGNKNQSFINQTSGIHTMYARLNELDVQCVINRSLLHRICPTEAIGDNKECSININKVYNEIRTAKNYKGYALESFYMDYNALKELPFLIANWIFCLHNMLQIMQTKGSSYLITYSTLADQYRRLGDVLKYYELCRLIHENHHDFASVYELTVELIGVDALKSMDPTSMYQLATRNYRLAMAAHNRGSAYRYLISNMYFLEDDFHDNLFHFSIAFERQRINSGEIVDKLRDLNQELSISQFFDYDAHINNTPIQKHIPTEK